MDLASYRKLAGECIKKAGIFLKCCEEYLDTDYIEPLEGRSTFDVERSCILICKKCGRKYVSRYD
jgi:hypothetical protein